MSNQDSLDLAVIRASGAWFHWHDEKWCAMKHVGDLVLTSEGATVEEALKGLEVMA